MRKGFIIGAAILTGLAALSIDFRVGDLRYEVGNKTLRHWAWVDFSRGACADFGDTGGYPCGGVISRGNYTLSGPATAIIGSPTSAFTVTDVGTIGSSDTITPSDASHNGVFSPTTVTLPSGTNTSATFTYTPFRTGSWNISTTNSPLALIDPAPLAFSLPNVAVGYPGYTTGWIVNNDATFTTGISPDPFGGANAARLVEGTAASGEHSILSSSFAVTSGQAYTVALMIHPGTGTRAVMTEFESFSGATGVFFTYNTADGTFGGSFTFGGATLNSTSSVAMSGGWWLVKANITLSGASNAVIQNYLVSGGTADYAGDGSSSALIYGPVVQ